MEDSILGNNRAGLTKDAREIIETAIPQDLIKKRDAGYGKKLNYISGSTVISLLNQAFNYRWSFVIKDERVVESKVKKDGKEQPPYIQVLGQLTIPDLGVVKEQFGTKILLGGASEQEGAAKAAATDALKKCATLVGIGLDLYDDSDIPADQKPATKQQPVSNTGKTVSVSWDPKDIEKLKELKAILDINDNPHLDAYVKEFMNSGNATYKDITPLNIKKFNQFLQSKAEMV